MSIQIAIIETHLSDDSAVYSLEILDSNSNGPGLSIPCVTMTDALALSEKIGLAISAHTNEDISYL